MSLDLSFTTHPKDLWTAAKWLQIEKNIQALILMLKAMEEGGQSREILNSIMGKCCATVEEKKARCRSSWPLRAPALLIREVNL